MSKRVWGPVRCRYGCGSVLDNPATMFDHYRARTLKATCLALNLAFNQRIGVQRDPENFPPELRRKIFEEVDVHDWIDLHDIIRQHYPQTYSSQAIEMFYKMGMTGIERHFNP